MMKIQQIRNATLIITYANKRFLIDPMFAPKDFYPPIPKCFNPNTKWPLVDLPFAISKIIDNIDAVILTHYHIDHFDEFAVQALPKSLKIYVQDDIDKQLLINHDFTNIEVLTKEGNSFDDIKLYKVDCQHGIKALTVPYFEFTSNYFNMSVRYKAMGVIFQHKDEETLYLAGDTIFCDFVKNAIAQYAPAKIIINCADAQFEHSGSIIMGTDDILKLHQYAPNLKIIASHLDTVGHATLNRQQLSEFITQHKLTDYIFVPKDGEII